MKSSARENILIFPSPNKTPKTRENLLVQKYVVYQQALAQMDFSLGKGHSSLPFPTRRPDGEIFLIYKK